MTLKSNMYVYNKSCDVCDRPIVRKRPRQKAPTPLSTLKGELTPRLLQPPFTHAQPALPRGSSFRLGPLSDFADPFHYSMILRSISPSTSLLNLLPSSHVWIVDALTTSLLSSSVVSSMASNSEEKIYTIIQADGLYPVRAFFHADFPPSISTPYCPTSTELVASTLLTSSRMRQ